MTFPCLVCCSIKADRTECPCYLSLTVDGGNEKCVDVDLSGNGLEISEQICVNSPDSVYELVLPRNDFAISVFSGLHSCSISDACVRIPTGCQMDELYAWSSDISTRSETLTVRAEQEKQHAYVHISMEYESGRHENGLMRFESNVCGVDLHTMDPLPGTFEIETYPVFDNYYRVCVPRQLDDSMVAIIEHSGRVMPLGKVIAAAGFDWTKRNLDDVYVTMNDMSATITVEVVEWEDGSRRRVVI